ncbi:hypothetical protein GCM10009846_17110 [Agrococcus versicolor]|uniref:Potassium transporter Trk n=1 Tax=Agrococcus versicolor TaxID=501482 RepID=A0ABP5MGR4_9MICO
MQDGNGYARSLTIVGIFMLIGGTGLAVIAIFVVGDAASFADATLEEYALRLVLAWVGGALVPIGILATLLGVVVSGVHASLAQHARVMRQRA